MGFTGYIDALFKETNDIKILHKRGSIKKKHKTKKCKKCKRICKVCEGCKGCKKDTKKTKKNIPKRNKSKYSNKKPLKILPARYSYYM